MCEANVRGYFAASANPFKSASLPPSQEERGSERTVILGRELTTGSGK